ncbi:hypothetical protein [Xanthobacter autotrophicus]|uniref:hypothetical protein n=1 Tax=Xanthobacter autotrophicus TaxID=280 RepID=UPI0024A6D26F|nr:hypothetical protein [Xanthobacter autotrophicus]MDI4655878.1 hypothetical protein [Xanthobacter autotrophicus]
MLRDGKIRRDRPDVERLADEIAQRHHKLIRVDGASGSQLAHGAFREANLLFGSEQDDVRKRCLHRVADTAPAVRARIAFGPRILMLIVRLAARLSASILSMQIA